MNGGTGPARVIALRVTVDGRAVKNWFGAQVALGGQAGGVVQSTLSRTVLPAGKDVMLVRPNHLTIDICDCSVLDDCRRLDAWARGRTSGYRGVVHPCRGNTRGDVPILIARGGAAV
jgi:hypothetical protein